MTKNSSRKKQWLWFIGLYIGSILAVAGVASLFHLFLPA